MLSSSAPRGPKHRAQKPRSSSSNLAERFLELQRLRKKVYELEKLPSAGCWWCSGGPRGTPEMTAKSHTNIQMLGLSAKPAWAQTWHLWRVIIPRRSITGRLVFGNVWRRHDGRHWIYKKVINEYLTER
jgi:hypothetical protein